MTPTRLREFFEKRPKLTRVLLGIIVVGAIYIAFIDPLIHPSASATRPTLMHGMRMMGK